MSLERLYVIGSPLHEPQPDGRILPLWHEDDYHPDSALRSTDQEVSKNDSNTSSPLWNYLPTRPFPMHASPTDGWERDSVIKERQDFELPATSKLVALDVRISNVVRGSDETLAAKSEWVQIES